MTYVFLAAFLLSLIVLFLLYQRYQATLRLLTEAETRSKQSEDRLSEASLQLLEAQRGREEALLHGAGMKA